MEWIKERLFNEEENLWSSLSYDRIKEILLRPEIRVLSFSLSENSYGRFWFLTIDTKDSRDKIVFHGLGHHELRNRYILDKFDYYCPCKFPEEKIDVLDKDTIINKLEAEYVKFKRYCQANPLERDSHDKMFEQLADMSDDDAALSMMEDMAYID